MRLSQLLKGYFGGDDRDERVRRKLVETLYTQPTSLAAGAMAGIACCLTAMLVAPAPGIIVTGGLLIVTAIARFGIALWLARDTRQRDARNLEIIYEVGAFTYAFLSGLAAAFVLSDPTSGHLQTLMVAYALVYGVGISARNAGRPIMTLSRAENSSNRVMIWNERAMPLAAMRCGLNPVTSSPPSRTRPRLGFTRPVRTLKKVVLPAPFGPITP